MKSRPVVFALAISLAITWAIRFDLGKLFNSRSSTSSHGLTKQPTNGLTSAKILQNYGNLPLRFEANTGQTDPRVKFLSRGPGYTLFLTAGEAVLSLSSPEPRANSASPAWIGSEKHDVVRGAVVRFKLFGANPAARVEGVNELPGRSNYFVGNDPANWRTNVPAYGKVTFSNVYPGVDLVYHGNRGRMEHDFIVAPGADPDSIKMVVEGAEKLVIDAGGALIVSLPHGQVRMEKPVVYQDVSNFRREVAASFDLEGTDRVGFQLGEYDARRPLIIDPVLVYSTYLGGNGFDGNGGMAVDSAGSAYVAAQTTSSNFPTAGAIQPAHAGGVHDAFVAKLSPDGSTLVYSTYLGGGGGDSATSIAVDSTGSAYIAGNAGPGFPTTPVAFQTSFAGGICDAFVTKLNPTGSGIVYSTYIGAGGCETAIVGPPNPDGSMYVVLGTSSSGLPTTPGAFQPAYAGGITDLYVAKLDSTGSTLLHATYLGASGNSEETPFAIVVDSAGYVYVVGNTGSNFPVTPGAFQTVFLGDSCCGNNDPIVAKLNPSLTALVYSTYLATTGLDQIFAIAVDSSGSAYVSGHTRSASFPTTPGAFQTAYGGGSHDAFVTKLNPTGTGLVYSTFLGGNSSETATYGIFVDAAGSAFVAGGTASTNFPTVNPIQSALAGCSDAFVAQLNSTGSALLFSTYFGGTGGCEEGAQDMAVDSAGSVYIMGPTPGAFPTTPGAFQSIYGGGATDIFVAKLVINQPPVADAGADQTVECNSHTGTSVTLDGSASSDPDAGDTLSYKWRDADNNVIGTSAAENVSLPPGTHTFTLTVSDGNGGSASDSVQVIVQDTTPPSLTLSSTSEIVVVPTASSTGVAVDVLSVSGAAANDLCDPSPTLSHDGPAVFPIGTTVVTITATDDGGNYSQKQFTVHVIYNFIGFLMPIRNDGSSIFKSGRTIPVKFQLTAADGSFITNATATLAVFMVTDQVLGTVEEVTPDASGSSNVDNLFRYDSTANQYIYNLSTNGYAVGTYLLRAVLNDGTVHEVYVSVR